MSNNLPHNLQQIGKGFYDLHHKKADKEIAKAVNKEMRLILKDYRFFAKGSKQIGVNTYNAMEWGIKNRLRDVYKDSIEFKHMNHRSVLLFIQLNVTLRAVPFHQVFVNKELLL